MTNNNCIYNRNYDYIYFGSFPQIEVKDIKLIEKLNNEAGGILNKDSFGKWNEYNEYNLFLGDKENKNCWYIDIEIDGEKYRGIYFLNLNSYRGCNSKYIPEFKKECIKQKYEECLSRYKYKTKTIYWFKYEKIKWRVLNIKNYEAFLVSEKILDSKAYSDISVGTNYYISSYIRNWLNNDFINTAFTKEGEKKIILNADVDNSEISCEFNKEKYEEINEFTSSNTSDYVFLLSVNEATNSKLGFKGFDKEDNLRKKEATDYARLMGVNYIDNKSNKYSYWILRSPANYINHAVNKVNEYGKIESLALTVDFSAGIVPGMSIRL